MKQRSSKHHMDAVFVLLVFTVFAACVLLVLLTGAGVYQRLSARDGETYDRRICVSYLAAKVRRADAVGGVFVGDFSGSRQDSGDTLFLTEEIDGARYDTRIYYYDGYVRELFAAADGTFSMSDGDPVLAAKGLSFRYDPERGLLTVQTEDASGAVSALSLSLRSGGGAAS